MLVRVKASGCVEEVHDFIGVRMCERGEAVLATPAERILRAENHGGPAATTGIEVAMLAPKVERAVLYRRY